MAREDSFIVGRITKIVAGAFTVVAEDGNEYILSARGTLRHKQTDLYVGDFVEFSLGAIERLARPRKNFFIRPYVANIDQIAVVVAPVPQPDRVLLDKLLIKADIENIASLLIINKSDIDKNNEFADNIIREYREAADQIIIVSSKRGHNLKPLEAALAGKLTALAGQSAVGKSSLLNALQSDLGIKTGGLSARIERGKHTTRHSEIYSLSGDIFVVDTPGFSMYKLSEVAASKLGLLYKDIFKFLPMCKFNMCTHTNELSELCAVKQAVEKGEIAAGRYQRYLKIYRELTDNEKSKY